MKRNLKLAWYEVLWQRPFELSAVYDLLTLLASTTPRGPVIWEVRGQNNKVRFLVGTFPCYSRIVHEIFRANGKVRFSAISDAERTPMTIVRRLKISKPSLSLKTDAALSAIRSGLAAMSRLPRDVTATLQVVFGPAYAPTRTPQKIADPHATWYDYIIGSVGEASAESLANIRSKTLQHGFYATIRVGISDSTKS